MKEVITIISLLEGKQEGKKHVEILLKDVHNLLEDLLLLFNLQPGITLVAVTAPPPPPLHIVRGHEVGESL